MAAVTQRAGAGPHTLAAHVHLTSVLAAQEKTVVALATAAAETVRAWMIEHGRALVTVDVARAVVGLRPSIGEELATAVAHLPRGVFGWGLDNRGQYSVRLGDVNAYLGRARDDMEPTVSFGCGGPRLEVLVEYGDYPTDVLAFVDGQSVAVEEYTVDPGAGYEWQDWTASHGADIAAASPAVAAILRARVLGASTAYLDNAPDDPADRARDLDAQIEIHRAERNR